MLQRDRPARWPRGLRRPDAADYVGVGVTKFDDWVARGIMPKPKRVDGVVVWDRYALDTAFDDLASEGEQPVGWVRAGAIKHGPGGVIEPDVATPFQPHRPPSKEQIARDVWQAKDPDRQAKWAAKYQRAEARGDKAEMRRLVTLGYRPPSPPAGRVSERR